MVFEEFAPFTRRVMDLLDDDDLARVQGLLLVRPDAGKVIPKSGGLRKLRVAAKGHGKRGGARMIYYWVVARDRILLLDIYAKNEKQDLSAGEGLQNMNKERFEELSEALRQAKAVRRGETAPSRVWGVTRGSNGQLHRRQLDPKEYQRGQQAEWENKIAATRTRLRLSQTKFAQLLGISVKTLHNWEQGRRKPTGAARILLRVAARHPEVVLEEAMA